ncbi:MAG TPA: DNA ligase D [Methylocella sp.]|nr:DNA ligase D [Methylocella sp.]
MAAGRTKKMDAEKPLKAYAAKRDFSKTPEPAASSAPAEGYGFVVQKHAARRLHYDLRLEMDGVLKSWAVTKGPSLIAGEKRLAVRTEDHPVEYLDFEGNIPKGEYGAGSMIIWDHGQWQPEGDPQKGLAKGHLAFTLHGARLKGLWHLVRMKPRQGEKTDPWLLIKSEDEFARPAGNNEMTELETTSWLSGLTNEELAAAGGIREDHAARARVGKARKTSLPDVGKLPGARRGLLPTFLEPSLAAPCEKPPSGPKWIHEIKYDGYRIQARIDGDAIRLLTRKTLDWTERFASIAEALRRLQLGSAWLDGELVVESDSGVSSFNDLQAVLKSGHQNRFRYYVFDLLYCDGYDLTKVPLKDRKELASRLLESQPSGSPIRLSEHLDVDGPTMLEHACRFGLEGIVSKRLDLPYRSGRGSHWLKSKCLDRQEFVVLGYVPSTAASRSVGALALGYYDHAHLLYAGRTGTGWSQDEARSLRERLEEIGAGKPPLAKPLPDGAEKGVHWVHPRLVCEIEYRGLTADRLLRAAAFKGMRDDKPAGEIYLEAPPMRSNSRPSSDPNSFPLTHPDRILWPEAGITKQGLADFYTSIADWILPHITHRPLSLLRCPSGTAAKCFFVKHPWQGLDEHALRVETGKEKPTVAIADLTGLLSLVQAGVVEIHPWGSTIDDLERPDRVIFDLDPGENVTWEAMIEAARDVRHRLATLGLQSFVKTSGGKGLHIVAPLQPEAGWDAVKAFTKTVAETMAKERPERYVATMAKQARHTHIFIDYLRNVRGATAVAAYSTRASPKATVSTPLDWDELSPALRSDHFTVQNLPHRLAFLKRDPWPVFFSLRQRLPQ